jgi:TonB-linked SusC/RagA family outer membrane protein
MTMIKLKTVPFLVSFLVMNLLLLRAQDSVLIKGVILSDINKPLSDVSVNIEGSANLPSVTNEMGEFSLMSAADEAWLIVSPTGDYKTKRIFLNNRTALKIFLTPEDISAGDDKLSILSQEVRRRNIISSYSELNIQDIHHSPVLTVDQYMQGKISGVYVINRSGMPGSGALATIRGVNSINASNQPLYIVDGIPLTPHSVFGSNLNGYDYNPLVGINPFVISKTTIIKDPTITAAYGSKGSNGLVLIETLDPSVTQTTIELDIRTGLSLSPPVLIPQLNAEQHKTLMSEVLFSSGMFEEDIVERYPTLFLTKDDEQFIEYQHNTNWQELIFKDAYFSNINLNVKGGDEIARYGLSFRYTDNKGIIKTTGFQGYNLRFVSRLNIFTWLRMNAGVSLNYNSSKLKEAATVEETSPIFASLAKSPLLNPYQYDIEGKRLTTLAEVDEIGISNPLAIINNYEATNNNYNFVATADFESSFLKNFLVNSRFSLTYNVMKEEIFMPNHGMELYYDQEAINVAKGTNNDFKSFYNNTYLTFNKSIGNDHVISSVTGLHILSDKFQLDWALTKNAHENDQYRTLQDGQDNLREMGGQNRTWNWLSAYENFFYSYKDRYLMSAGISLDGSSRLGDNAINTIKIADVPFGLFYSGGLAWRLSNESFLKNMSWIEDLKIRFSAGKTGNDDIGESSATKYYQTVKFRTTAGLFPAVLPNDALSYETVYQLNTGIDLSLLGNRFTTSFDLFSSRTENMLIFSPEDAFLGYDMRVENGGQLKNNGWEANVFVRILDRNSFKWDLTANLSTFKNEITEIKGEKLITKIEGAEIINMTGSPANSFYGYIFKGVFSTQAEATEANLVNGKAMPFQAGDAIFEDLSGPDGIPDGVINDYDKTTIGSALPQYFGGIINSFSFRRWTLSAFVQFVYGNDVFNYIRYKNERMTGLENQSRDVLNRWQYDGQVTDVPRALWDDPIGNAAFSTRWIEDGSYLRIKNISLSYRVPNQFLSFRNAEFYFSVNNIYTLSRYLGYDPEFAYSFSQINQGIDYGQCPQPRQFVAGIRLGL